MGKELAVTPKDTAAGAEIPSTAPDKPVKKTKVLWWGDSPTTFTGYAVVNGNLAMGLHNTGRYEITFIGVNYRQVMKHNLPFFIYPLANNNDPFGLHELQRICDMEKPDIVFVNNDAFILGQKIPGPNMSPIEIFKSKFPGIPLISYFPVDGNTFSEVWSNEVIKKSDYSFTISKHSQNTIKECTGDAIDILPHGIDTKTFRPLDANRILALKRDQGEHWTNKFCVVSINRFQPRKGVNIMLKILQMFMNGYKVCSECGNYFQLDKEKCDLNKCNAPFETHNRKLDAMCYLHMNNADPYVGNTPADTLGAISKSVGFKDFNNQVFSPNFDVYSQAMSPDQVNNIYNIGDVFMTTTLGEGFGITTAEAMAAGTTVVGPKNTTFFEICKDTCRLVDNAGFVAIGHDSGQVRPVIDVAKAVQTLEDEYELWLSNDRKKVINKRARHQIEKHFQWAPQIEKLDKVIQRELNKPQVTQKAGEWLGTRS